jgi:hypothetical protein
LVVVEVEGLGELDAEGELSRLGREDEVGVMRAWVEFVRRKGPEGSRGEAIVDMPAVVLFEIMGI